MKRKISTLFFVLTGAVCLSSYPVQAQKKVLTQDDFPGWKQITAPVLSDDGRWVAYALNPAVGDGVTIVYDSNTGYSDTLHRATGARFFAPEKNGTIRVAYKVRPTHEQLRQAKIKKTRPDQMPKDTLRVKTYGAGNANGIVVLSVPNLKSLELADKGAKSLVAYSYEVTPVRDTADKKAPRPKKFTRLVVWDVLRGADSIKVDSVDQFSIARTGDLVLYALKGDSLRSVWALTAGRQTELYQAKVGTVGTLAVDEAGRQAAYLVTADTTKTGAKYQLYYVAAKDLKPQPVAAEGAKNGYVVSEFGSPEFSRNGTRLEFGMAMPSRVLPKDTLPDDEKFSLDLWSYTDTLLMTQQLATLKRLKEQTYPAAYYPATRDWVLLGDKSMARVQFAEDEKSAYALGSDDGPYQWASTWESSGKRDLYRVNVQTGERTLMLEGVPGMTSLSPKATYAVWYDPDTQAWKSMEWTTGKVSSLTEKIPYQMYVQGHDVPSEPRAEGLAGWTKDEKVIIYDNFDLWLADPSGKSEPLCLTKGVGRRDSTTFRYVRLDREERTIDLSKPLLLSAFNRDTKDQGFYSLNPDHKLAVRELVLTGHKYTFAAKAEKEDVVLFQRENFNEYRDLWMAPLSFSAQNRISEANPQQKEYKWGRVERMNWTDLNGKPAEGLLYLPEDYDPSRKYPVIFYFYETHVDAMHNHLHPQPSWSIVIPSVCTSQDYIVFMPDIAYRTGYPGQSCYDAVMSGAMMLVDKGIADPKRMGLQGQSWGGYQIAYLVTRTDMFACASPGAPVANMTSAFGGIRWGTGMPRMFQYEHGQSRIGGSLWEKPIEYIENSPLFFANKVKTPTLMRHDDADEAVPWYQGIEYFLALRRHGVAVWMLNYNGQPHNLRSWPAKMDWDRRMMQFFDYYLKDEPMPRWMQEGLPAVDKGIDQRYEYVDR